MIKKSDFDCSLAISSTSSIDDMNISRVTMLIPPACQDLLSALIKGPTRTPYEDGLFLFDIQLPNIYPAVPPLFSYLSQVSGRLNPNLYDNGKVCVSLLGTWIGKVRRARVSVCVHSKD